MMGERRMMQEALFYGFSLERHVPNGHLLRKMDRFVDLSEVRAHPRRMTLRYPTADAVGEQRSFDRDRRPPTPDRGWR
jgi:hypothetical protein